MASIVKLVFCPLLVVTDHVEVLLRVLTLLLVEELLLSYFGFEEVIDGEQSALTAGSSSQRGQ
jgi:hypothetical protein